MGGSILVVEDDPTLIHAVTRNLVTRGYTVRAAATVREALALLQTDQPSVALIDIDLPDGSGWEVMRALRALRGPDRKGIPAIVMSALRPNARLCAEMDAVGVLEKPFPMESLLRLVAQHSGRSSRIAPAAGGLDGE